MKKIIKEEIELEFIVGETYTTRFTSAERFKVTEVVKDKVWGIYENNQHLGICPIGADRLIPRTELTGKEYEVNLCPHCKKTFV